jgi:hypothetical protein
MKHFADLTVLCQRQRSAIWQARFALFSSSLGLLFSYVIMTGVCSKSIFESIPARYQLYPKPPKN